MDHMASAYGGICRFNFADIQNPVMEELDSLPSGGFILFDSLQRKDTIRVLKTARKPVEKAIELLHADSVSDIGLTGLLESDLPDEYKKPAVAALYNYEILREFAAANESKGMKPEYFGKLLYEHHCRLRDGLGISTAAIEEILDTAIKNGALGGKLNGTGGGGCCYVFAHEKDLNRIMDAVESKGYPSRIIRIDSGARVDERGKA